MKYQFFCKHCGYSSLHDTKQDRNVAAKMHNPPRVIGRGTDRRITKVCADLMRNETGQVRRKDLVPEAAEA